MKSNSWVLPVLNLLGIKRDEPVQIGGAVASPFAMPSAQIIPLHPRSDSIEDPQELEESDDGVITSLNRIPPGTILTADVGVRYFRLPKGQEASLLALEVSPKRVAVFYSTDDDKAQLDRLIGELRHRLLIDGYELVKEPRACDPSIIRAILENHKRSAEAQESSSENSPARQLWERIVDVAWRSGASDLHIEMREPMAHIKVRIDNDLIALPDGGGGVYTSSQVQAAVAWAFGDTTEKNSNNGSMFSVDAFTYSMFKPRLVDGTKVGMRFQSLKGGAGPKAITRMFQVDSHVPTRSFQELGYSESQRRLLRKAQKRSSGLVLFGGVTNSGKTVALKTFMETHPMNGAAAFYSIEDPIELPIKNVHAIPVQRDLSDPEQSDKAYSEVISSVMRADPDGLLISEIRDRASAAAAEQMLETGHFAAASIHAKFIHGFVSRLSMPKIGFDRAVFTEPDVITLLNYQSLVAVICPKCRINAGHTDQFTNIHFHTNENEERINEVEDVRALISTAKSKFRLDPSSLYFRRKGGCPHCKERGTVGRTVVSEMYMPDRTWLKMVRDRQDFDAIDYYRSFSDGDFTSPDMTGKSIFEHTLYKAIRGQVDPRECEQFYGFEEFVIGKGKNEK